MKIQETAVMDEAVTEELSLDAQIQSWKKEFGKVFKNEVGGETYIWRRVKRQEYVNAMSFESEDSETSVYDRQAIIAKSVVLYPDAETMSERIEEYAGLATEIADRAIEKSGFRSTETEEL